MSEFVRSLLAEIAAALVLAGAAWALGQLRDRLLSRRPNYAWVPLAAISGLTIAIEVIFAYLARRSWITFPLTLLLFATPPLMMSLAVFLQLRPVWSVGVRGADRSAGAGLGYKKALELCHEHMDFLGTGAAKLTSESNFERVLARCRDDQPLRFLLSRPDTATLTAAAQRYGRDREDYARIVLGSLRKLADIKVRRALGHFQVRFYETPPAFRLMFVDNNLCLVSPTIYGRGDGSQLPQLHIARPRGEGASESVYHAFEIYFNDLWSRSEEWDFRAYL